MKAAEMSAPAAKAVAYDANRDLFLLFARSMPPMRETMPPMREQMMI